MLQCRTCWDSTLVGWEVERKDGVCACVSQSMSPSHLLYKGSLSGVQELLTEWHSCLAEPLAIWRNLRSAHLQLSSTKKRFLSRPRHHRVTGMCALFFTEVFLLLCLHLMGLSLRFWGQCTSVEARTGYLSGYISSSALYRVRLQREFPSRCKASDRARSSYVDR